MPVNTDSEVPTVAGWPLDDTISEYKGHAEPKVRDVDVDYIRTYQLSSLAGLFAKDPGPAYTPSRMNKTALRLLLASATCLFLCFTTWTSFAK